MSWNPHRVTQKAPVRGDDPDGWVIELDGVPLRHVTATKVETDVKGLTTFTVTFYASVNDDREPT